MAAPFADATLFPFPPDPQYPASLAEEFATDIAAPEGKEIRASMREQACRTLSYTAILKNARQSNHFAALWLAADEIGRFIVPLWPESARLDAIALDLKTLTLDTTNRDGFVAGGRALLFQSPDECELVTIDTVTDTEVVLVDTIDGLYVIGAVALVPVMNAWLAPPQLTELNLDAEQIPLTFVEELDGIAGITPDVDGVVTPDVVTVTLEVIYHNTDRLGKKAFALEAHAFDDAGMEIDDPGFSWVYMPVGGADASPKVNLPKNERQLSLRAVQPSVGLDYHVTASVGAVSSPTAILPAQGPIFFV